MTSAPRYAIVKRSQKTSLVRNCERKSAPDAASTQISAAYSAAWTRSILVFMSARLCVERQVEEVLLLHELAVDGADQCVEVVRVGAGDSHEVGLNVVQHHRHPAGVEAGLEHGKLPRVDGAHFFLACLEDDHRLVRRKLLHRAGVVGLAACRGCDDGAREERERADDRQPRECQLDAATGAAFWCRSPCGRREALLAARTCFSYGG